MSNRTYWVLGVVAMLAACNGGEVRGVFVARFDNDQDVFSKRIAVPSPSGPVLALSLPARKYLCELRVTIPDETDRLGRRCEAMSGTGRLLCSDARDMAIGWRMTSCHSGFGRSVEGVEPAFVFGFSGNANTAFDQLDLARQTRFPAPEAERPREVVPDEGLEKGPEKGLWGDSPWAIPYLGKQ